MSGGPCLGPVENGGPSGMASGNSPLNLSLDPVVKITAPSRTMTEPTGIWLVGGQADSTEGGLSAEVIRS